MAEKVVGFSALSHYDSKIKALTVGTIEIAGNVFTFKAVDGTIIGTATLPKTVYNLASATEDGLMTKSDFSKLQTIAEGATKVEAGNVGYIKINGVQTKVYLPDSVTALPKGLYKITTNAYGAVTVGEAVTKSDLVALGLPSENTTYGDATQSASGLLSANDKKKLDSVQANATNVQESSSNGYLVINGSEVLVYEPDTQTALASGLYKFATNKYGQVTAGVAVTKSDLVALGLPAQDTTYSLVTVSADGLMSATDKVKLNSVEQGAQANKIEGISINGVAQTISGKTVNLDLSSFAKKTDLVGLYEYKGSVANYSNLPTNPEKGDVYNIENADETNGILAGDNVVWDGSKWDKLGGTFTIDVVTNAEIDTLFDS